MQGRRNSSSALKNSWTHTSNVQKTQQNLQPNCKQQQVMQTCFVIGQIMTVALLAVSIARNYSNPITSQMIHFILFRVVVARDKVLQLLGRDMKFSLRRANIYELTDLSVLSWLLNSTINKNIRAKVDNKLVREFKFLASAACPSIGSQPWDRQKQSCSISEASQMPNDQFIANCLRKVNLVLESPEFASKVVRLSSKYPYQAQISDCKQEIADPTVPDSDPLDNLAKCALIQICFERGYEYHDIARRLCSKPNSFSMELSNYAVQRFSLKCSEFEFIKAIKRSWEISQTNE